MNETSIFNYEVLWDKVSNFARNAGRVSARPALLLYYVMKSKDTPFKDKMLIFLTLSIILSPIDILNVRRLPVISKIDEIISLSVAYQIVRKNITPEIEMKVNAILDRWFPEYDEYIELPVKYVKQKNMNKGWKRYLQECSSR